MHTIIGYFGFGIRRSAKKYPIGIRQEEFVQGRQKQDPVPYYVWQITANLFKKYFPGC